MALDLEEIIGILMRFINETKDIDNLMYIYEWISKENDDYIRLKGPFSRIKCASEQLKQLAQEEKNLHQEYDRIMLQGNYDPFAPDDFFKDAAEIARKRQGLAADAEITIYEEDMIAAEKKQRERRSELRGKDFDYNKPLEILIKVVQKRASVYLNPNYTNMIKDAYELIKPLSPFQPAPNSWKSEQEQQVYMEQQETSRNVIRERIGDFFEYLGEFFQGLTKLIEEYSGEEFKLLKIKLEKHPAYKKPT